MIPSTSLKIQGFQSLFRSQSRFSSLKAYFQKQDSMNFIEFSHNSNIKSFYILLMNYIQRQHYKKLVFQNKTEEQSIQSGFRRQRKVSFNGKNNGVFIDSQMGQTITLHKLKNYIFSQSSYYQIIENSPMKESLLKTNDQNKINVVPKYTPYLKRQFSSQIQKEAQYGKSIQKDFLLTSKDVKKILAQFLKMLLPQSIDKNYKSQIKSVNSLIQLYPAISVALNILMRFILLTKYKITQAKYYDQVINDNVVIHNLCDAFNLQGLKQIQHGFQIKKQYKIYIIKWCFKQSQINHQILFQNLNLKNSKIRETQTSQNKERQDSKNKNQKQVYIVAMPKEFNTFNNSFLKSTSINLNLKKRNQVKINKEKKIKDKEKNKSSFFGTQKLPKFNNLTDILNESQNLKHQNLIGLQNTLISSQSKKQCQMQRPFFSNFRKSLKQIQSKRGSYNKSSEPNSPSSPSKKFTIDPKIHQQLNLSHSYHSNLDKSDFQISNNQILDDIQKVLNLGL